MPSGGRNDQELGDLERADECGPQHGDTSEPAAGADTLHELTALTAERQEPGDQDAKMEPAGTEVPQDAAVATVKAERLAADDAALAGPPHPSRQQYHQSPAGWRRPY